MAVHFSTARWACLAAHFDGGEVGVRTSELDAVGVALFHAGEVGAFVGLLFGGAWRRILWQRSGNA